MNIFIFYLSSLFTVADFILHIVFIKNTCVFVTKESNCGDVNTSRPLLEKTLTCEQMSERRAPVDNHLCPM